MSTNINLKNSTDTTFSITHSDGANTKVLDSKDIAVAIDTVADFPANPNNGDVVIVRDLNRGGTFIYDSSEVAGSNDGTNFDGWIRQYSGAVNVKWFGAVGDGIVDDTAIIQGILNLSHSTFEPIYIPIGTYLISSPLTLFSNTTIEGTPSKESILLFTPGINGLKNPDINNGLTNTTVKNLTVRGSNPSHNEGVIVADTSGINIDCVVTINNLKVDNVTITGFKNGVNLKAPCYLCSFSNMLIYGIINRNASDTSTYLEDGSFGMMFGYKDETETRDCTTIFCTNIFISIFEKNFYNNYCTSLNLVSCTSERGYYGVYTKRGLKASMYQELNKISCKHTATHIPYNTTIDVLNDPSSWAVHDIASSAIAYYNVTNAGNNAVNIFTSSSTIAFNTGINYATFNQYNNTSISPTTEIHAYLNGIYKITVDFVSGTTSYDGYNIVAEIYDNGVLLNPNGIFPLEAASYIGTKTMSNIIYGNGSLHIIAVKVISPYNFYVAANNFVVTLTKL